MRTCKTIQIKDLGPVLFVSSARAKRLSITVKHDRTIRVTRPWGLSLGAAEKFLRSRVGWVKKHVDRLKKLEETPARVPAVNRTKAKIILAARLNYLAKEYGFSYNKLFLRNQKTRWGTCSSKNNIGLNMNLVRLPDELQDYVILHELVHTRHKNHGREFWAEMNRLLGNTKQLRKKLRTYRLGMD
ncbi:MAG: M48 family metallopeptidase [Planctomycetota bacterium]|jgi:predicted metal-dependent hydrolase